jgi:hypothetical protein
LRKSIVSFRDSGLEIICDRGFLAEFIKLSVREDWASYSIVGMADGSVFAIQLLFKKVFFVF